MNNIQSSLSGKIALVTGGARGLGYEIVRQLAEAGASVIIGARDTVKAESAAEKLRMEGGDVSVIKLDVISDVDRIGAYLNILNTRSRLDILINNAGVLMDTPDAATPATLPPSEALPSVIRGSFEANFFAPVFLTQKLMPLLRKSESGRIVNVSSIRGSLAHLSDPESPVYPIRALGYDASKAALNAFTILIAEELRGTSIKVNAVHPGWLRTSMGGEQADMSAEEGARIVLKYAALPENGPTGGFFFKEKLPW